MNEGTEPCSCRFCLATEQVVSDAEPAWGMATTYMIACIDPERAPSEVMMHLTSLKHQFFCSGQLDLTFTIEGVTTKSPRLSVDIYWRFAPPVTVKSAGKV